MPSAGLREYLFYLPSLWRAENDNNEMLNIDMIKMESGGGTVVMSYKYTDISLCVLILFLTMKLQQWVTVEWKLPRAPRASKERKTTETFDANKLMRSEVEGDH